MPTTGTAATAPAAQLSQSRGPGHNDVTLVGRRVATPTLRRAVNDGPVAEFHDVVVLLMGAPPRQHAPTSPRAAWSS